MILGQSGLRATSGFTLVELLVAMTLIGLIFVALFGGLRFGARTWEIGNARSEDAAQTEVTQSLIRRQLAQTILLPGFERGEFSFEGDADRLRFTAPAPTQIGLGGVYLFELFIETSDQREQLVLRWRLHRPELDPDSPIEDEDRKTRVLIDGIEALRLNYFGDPEGDDDPDWSDTWRGHDVLPTLISIRLDLPQEDRRRWPDLLVAPRARLSASDL